MRRTRWKRLSGAGAKGARVLLVLMGCDAAWAQTPPAQVLQSAPKDLTQVSIENLMNVKVSNSFDRQTVLFVEGAAPDCPIQLWSHMDIRRSLAWDFSAYFVDDLANQGPFSNLKIPAYTRLDGGLTWKVGEGISVSLVGQNLLKDHHMEFEDVDGSMQS